MSRLLQLSSATRWTVYGPRRPAPAFRPRQRLGPWRPTSKSDRKTCSMSWRPVD